MEQFVSLLFLAALLLLFIPLLNVSAHEVPSQILPKEVSEQREREHIDSCGGGGPETADLGDGLRQVKHINVHALHGQLTKNVRRLNSATHYQPVRLQEEDVGLQVALRPRFILKSVLAKLITRVMIVEVQ